MPIYKKPSPELVFDLINEANPSLDIPLTPTNVQLGKPVALTAAPWPAANTEIEVSAAPGTTEYTGKKTLSYRRLEFASLWRGQTIQIEKYIDVTGMSSGTAVFTVHQLLGDINQQYGVNLTVSDVNNTVITRGSLGPDGQYTRTVTASARSDSLGYTGTFQLVWKNAKQSLQDMVTVRELNGRLYPGGNDFSGEHKDVLHCAGFSIDITATFREIWPGFGATALSDSNISSYPQLEPVIQAALTMVNAKCGTNYQRSAAGSYLTTPGDFAGFLRFSNRILPNTLFPETNSTDFNRCMIIPAPNDCPWGTGNLYLHYNYPFV